MSFLWFIIIGIVAGYVAGKIMRGGGFGLIVNLVTTSSISMRSMVFVSSWVVTTSGVT